MVFIYRACVSRKSCLKSSHYQINRHPECPSILSGLPWIAPQVELDQKSELFTLIAFCLRSEFGPDFYLIKESPYFYPILLKDKVPGYLCP